MELLLTTIDALLGSQGGAVAHKNRRSMAQLALSENLSYRLSMLHFLMSKATREIYGVHGLNSHQWKVLSVLYGLSRVSARDIAKWLTLDKAAISRAVQQLRELALADYVPNAADGRSVQIILTAKGKRLYAKMNRRVANLQNRLLAGLPPAKQRQFFEAIENLESALRSNGFGPPQAGL